VEVFVQKLLTTLERNIKLGSAPNPTSSDPAAVTDARQTVPGVIEAIETRNLSSLSELLNLIGIAGNNKVGKITNGLDFMY
jgi:hypothetical protein